jgi:hypothetical protein
MKDSRAGTTRRIPSALDSHSPTCDGNDSRPARLAVLEAMATAVNAKTGAQIRKVTRKKRTVSVRLLSAGFHTPSFLRATAPGTAPASVAIAPLSARLG